MNQSFSITETKNKLSKLINRAVTRHERITISKRGKPIAAIVSLEGLPQIDEKERQRLLKRAKEIKKSTKKYIPFEQAVRDYEKKWGVDLGLDFTQSGNVRH